MRFAIVGDNKHQKPLKGAKGTCPLCRETLVAKCGNIRIHHWAHPSDSQCPYKENKGEWHVNWQNEFPDDWQEIVLTDSVTHEKNIADVQTPTGFVLEFQHSHIKDEEKTARENFYKNMVWIVDGLNWKKIECFFETKYKTTQEIEKFKIDQYDYETNFSLIWANATVPIIYDFHDTKSPENTQKWREYLYLCFPYREFVGFYVIPIKKEHFIKIVKDDRLQKMFLDIQRNIDKISKHKQEKIDTKQEKLRKKEEAKQKLRLITRQNARPKAVKLKKVFEYVNQQNQFVHYFYDGSDTIIAKLKLTNGLKPQFFEDIYNPQYNRFNSNVWVECAANAYLCVDDEDIKNCNIRTFLCCPKKGQKLNDYYKNISKNTMFFMGDIGKEDNKKMFSGLPLVVFVDKGSKTISVLCKNFLDGKEQNSFSLVHIVFLYGVYYHYHYYSTKNISIFLKMVCNNNKITVSDIKIL